MRKSQKASAGKEREFILLRHSLTCLTDVWSLMTKKYIRNKICLLYLMMHSCAPPMKFQVKKLCPSSFIVFLLCACLRYWVCPPGASSFCPPSPNAPPHSHCSSPNTNSAPPDSCNCGYHKPVSPQQHCVNIQAESGHHRPGMSLLLYCVV